MSPELVERSDLPEGRQSKGSVDDEVPALADVIAGALSRNVLTGPMLLARAILEAGYARRARVRAEVAEQIALAIETHHAADDLTAIQSARIARHHAATATG